MLLRRDEERRLRSRGRLPVVRRLCRPVPRLVLLPVIAAAVLVALVAWGHWWKGPRAHELDIRPASAQYPGNPGS